MPRRGWRADVGQLTRNGFRVGSPEAVDLSHDQFSLAHHVCLEHLIEPWLLERWLEPGPPRTAFTGWFLREPVYTNWLHPGGREQRASNPGRRVR